MGKMIVGRRIVYLEIFEIDTDKIPSGRDNLDLCQRVLYAADPDLSQQLKTGKEDSGVTLLSRTQDNIIENPIYPAPEIPKGLNEATRIDY